MLLHRWQAPWHWLFYGTLLAATVLALPDEATDGRRAALLALSVGLGVWYWRTVISGRWLSGSRAWVSGNLGLGISLWIPLLLWNGSYELLVCSAYTLACSLPLSRAIPGIAFVSATIVATASITWDDVDGFMVAQWSGVTAAMGLLAAMVRSIERQSEGRRALIAELESTRGELAESERQAGVLAERQRLAREIHDTVAQGLASVVTLNEAARRELAHRPTTAKRYLEQANRSARESLAEARRFVWALTPAALEQTSLPAALEGAASRMAPETGIEANVVVTGTQRRLEPECESTLIRVAQEALANVRKHSRATTVTLTLSYMEDRTALDIRDDGIGFDQPPARPSFSPPTPAAQSGGFGLSGMRGRIEEAGGVLEIDSGRARGTTILVSFPTRTSGRAASAVKAPAAR